MKKGFIITALALSLFACVNTSENKELTEAEKREADSLSKLSQRRVADSMKKQNMMLIMPPDSEYTGDYVDKYPSGVIKFKGFFRFGERHGMWLSFYPSGNPWSELHYDKGLRNGPNTVYYIGGKKRYEGFYKNDKQDSIWAYYDSTGVLAEKVLYKEDRIIKRLPLK